MMDFLSTTLDIHAGHNHGAFGEFIEYLLNFIAMDERLRDCLCHIIVDTINVFFLLFAVMLVVFFVTSYVNVEKLHKKLGSLKSVGGFLLATGLGVLSPFCSCTIIPVLMGFLSMGVPVSVCLCYLTASSMLNVTAILSLSATTGFEFTLTYVICSILIIAVSSLIFSFFKFDHSIGTYHDHAHHHHHEEEEGHVETWKDRLSSSLSCTVDVFKRSYLFILLGVVLSSVIMTYFSIDSLSAMINDNSILSTLLVSVVGIPIHSDIFSIAPIIKLLLALSKSVALTFTLATMAISLPTIIILSRALKLKTVLTYCGVICGLTIATGFITLLFL